MSEISITQQPDPLFLTLMKGNKAGVWTTIGGGVLIFVIWQMALVLLAVNVPLVKSFLLGGDTAASARDEALGMALLLVGGFGPAFIVMLLWRKLMERRRFRSLVTAVARIRWRLMSASALIVGVMGLAITLPFDPESLIQINARLARFSAQDWLLLACAYGIGIFIQASFEELYVRGWLLQHISRFIPNAVAAIVITSLIFSAMHVGHPGWATYVVTLILGLAYGWSAFRLNGLEAAMGAHIANNLIGALLTGQMISGNPPTMDGQDFALYAAYVLGFLLFVEVWARFFEKPSRA
jgi:uncharacterized protein